MSDLSEYDRAIVRAAMEWFRGGSESALRAAVIAKLEAQRPRCVVAGCSELAIRRAKGFPVLLGREHPYCQTHHLGTADEKCGVAGCPRMPWKRGMCGIHLKADRATKGRRSPGESQTRVGGTSLVPAHWAFLDDFGVTYKQWHSWHARGWISGGFADVDRIRLRQLAEVSRLRAMPLNDLADLLASKEELL